MVYSSGTFRLRSLHICICNLKCKTLSCKMCYNVVLCIVVLISIYNGIWLYNMVCYTLGMGGICFRRAQVV